MYSHPQIDGKVNHHQISRDLLFHLFGDDYSIMSCSKYQSIATNDELLGRKTNSPWKLWPIEFDDFPFEKTTTTECYIHVIYMLYNIIVQVLLNYQRIADKMRIRQVTD